MSPPLHKVLIAEDDPDIQELAVMALEVVGGLAVIACDDGHAALREAREAQPDLIILDWMMPEMDGGQTLAALREDPATQHIPVVFLTAKVRPEEIARMRQLGAVDVIGKPFNPMQLASQVQNIWQHTRKVRPFDPV